MNIDLNIEEISKNLDIMTTQQITSLYKEVYTKKQELERVVYKKTFWNFSKHVLGWPDLYDPLHKLLCDFIQDNIKHHKLLILLPRGCFKSSVVTIGYPLYRIINDPTHRGLIANATSDLAVTFLGQIKKHLQQNPKLIQLYGNLSTDAPVWKSDAFAISHEKSHLTKEETLTAVGIGTNYTGTHYDYAVLDDLVNRDNIRSKERIEGVVDFYKDTLDLVDVNEHDHKEVVLIGTTWHDDDLYSRIQDPEEGFIQDFKVLRLPAYSGEWGTGKLLFPTRLTWNTLDTLKRQQGSAHFSAQYMLNPIPLETAIFKEKFQYYDPSDLAGLTLNKFVCVDPAISEKKTADYAAMACVGVDENNVWYILDLWREKGVSPKRLIEQMFIWDEKHRPITMGIETTAFQRTLKFYAMEKMRTEGKSFYIEELKHTDNTKDQRIRGLQPKHEAKQIFHLKDMRYNSDLEDEMRRYPKCRNDDLLDALASINEIAYSPRVKKSRSNKKRVGSRYPA